MRYIPKPNGSKTETLLRKARIWMRTMGISELYDNFNDKKPLNDFLREEQKNICCYCQRRIDHFQGDNERGSHNEHFEPENGPHAQPLLQLDYENIYACCNASKGFEKRLQHCGEHKGSDVIHRNFLRMTNCSDYFKYNTNGEILPCCPMNSYSEILANRDKLTPIQKDALQAIEVLNLNVDSLKDYRKNVQAEIFRFALHRTRQQLEHKVMLLNTAQKEYIPLVDMVLFFLKRIVRNK